MLIAILADIHDNEPNLASCLDWCRRERVSKLIVCGDLTALRTVAYLAAHFSGDIFMIDGNGELYETDDLKAYIQIRHYGTIGREKIGSLDIGFCHEPAKIKKVLALKDEKPDFIFYGHTHKPWLEKSDGVYVANPGNLAGIYYPATFSVLDTETKKLELKLLANL